MKELNSGGIEVLMIKLDEEDIKAIAYNRSYSKYRWWIRIILTIFVALLILCLYLSIPPVSGIQYLPLIPTILFSGILIFWSVVLRRAGKQLVTEWRTSLEKEGS